MLESGLSDEERAQPAAAPGNPAGKTLGRFGDYELLEEIARGGMGVVYRARDVTVNRIVALKMILTGQSASEREVKRFQAEAEAAAQLDHPNIVPLYEFSEIEGQRFLSMKLVEGLDLVKKLRGVPMDAQPVAELMATLARAIHHAHQRGVLHRDLKPANILVDAQGQPHVTDFGLAKIRGRESGLTLSSDVLGSPNYMAPEQAAGSSQLTTAADVYSLGAIMYEVLTGRPPFQSPTPLETMRKVMGEELIPPHSLYSFADRDLETICIKCMQKQAARRYGTALELAEDLERWLRHEPILARPVGGWERAAKWVRRRPLAAALSAITLLAVTASVGTLIRANVRIRTAQGNEARMRRTAEGQERIARQRAYASDINLAQQALAENNLGRARELLGRHRPGSAAEADLRGWEWRYLWLQCRSDALFSLARNQGAVYALAASPDARWLAVGSESRQRLDLWDFAARRLVKRLAEGVTSVHAAFSPTEPLLAYASSSVSTGRGPDHPLRLWNTATGAEAGEWLLPGHCAGLAFSANGQTLLTAIDEPDPQFMLWNVAARTVRSKLPTSPMRKTIGTPFAASRDLHWVATGLESDRIRVTDLTSGRVAWETSVGVPINALSIDPTGTMLAAGLQQTDALIQLYQLAAGQEIGRLLVPAGYVICMQFAPDGQTLLAAGSDQTITHWDVSRRQLLATMRGHSMEVWRLALLADGNRVVSGSGDGDILVWNLRTSGTHDFRATLPVASRACWRFTPGSDAILTCELDGGVTRWVGGDFGERQTLLNVGDGPVSVVLSEDCGTVVASFTNGSIRVFDLKNGALRREFKSGSNAAVIWGFADSSNRLLVVNEPDQSLHEWDLRTGTERNARPNLADWRVHDAFPGEARQLDAGRAVRSRFGSAAGTQRLAEEANRVFGGVFSSDDRYFAWSLPMGVVEMEDAGTGQLLGRIRGFLQGVHSLAFSLDNRRLAAGSDDRQAVKLWDIQSLQELVTLRGEGSSFSQTRFSPDGNLIGTMNYRGLLHVWRAPSWGEIEAAEQGDAKETRAP